LAIICFTQRTEKGNSDDGTSAREARHAFSPVTRSIIAIAFSPDGKLLAAGAAMAR
jgi:hypothetical protein